MNTVTTVGYNITQTVFNDSHEYFDPGNQESLRKLNDEHARILLPVMCFVGILMVAGAIGNSLVLYVYWLRTRQTAKRTFIIVLSGIDLTSCLLVMPVEILDMRYNYNFENGALCKVMRSVETATILSSGFTLIAICFDRYYSICKPLKRFTIVKVKVICALCILAALILAWPPLFLSGIKSVATQQVNVTGCECSTYAYEGDEYRMYADVYNYVLVITFIGSLLYFVFYYAIIGVKLWKRSQGCVSKDVTYSNRSPLTPLNSSSISSKEPANTAAKVARMVSTRGYAHGRLKSLSGGTTVVFFSVTVVFVVSFFPHLLARILQTLKVAFSSSEHSSQSDLAYNFLIRTYLLNNAANPFIYSILQPTFRRELRRAFKRCFRSNCCWYASSSTFRQLNKVIVRVYYSKGPITNDNSSARQLIFIWWAPWL